MITTTRQAFEFNASHAHAHNGNGATPHLHAYTVEVDISGDPSALDEAWRGIAALVANADLDAELVKPRHARSSSVQDLAAFLFGEFDGAVDGIEAVTVHDTPTTSATVRR